jgi:drug/metabolite transporter (DMT)-like permease
MLLATVVIWSFNITVTRYALTNGWHPLAYSSLRYSAAALLFAAVTSHLERSFRVGGRRDLVILLSASAFGVVLNQLTFVYSVKLTNATTLALILGITPVFTALTAFAVGFERLPARFWAGALVSFAGVALVALGAGEGGVSFDVVGDLLCVATAATWAVYSVLIAPLMRRYSPYRISAIVIGIGCLPLLLLASRQLAAQDFGRLGLLEWLAIAFATLGPLLLTNLLWFRSIDAVGPSRATLFANLQPFVAAIFALAILSEPLTALQVAGGVAIGAGLLLSRRRAGAAIPAAE